VEDDIEFLRTLRRWILGLVVGLALIGGAATIISSAFNLAWMPWQVHLQTQIIRNSNSYITTQQAALRAFRADYDGASPGQRAALIRQMREIADTIPSDVQPDIAAFLGGVR
jgi:hypothetical protein